MGFTAFIMVAWIYVTPCDIAHPPEVTCREYKVHLAAERALISSMEVSDEE